MPSKPPLERMATTSPDFNCGAMLSTMFRGIRMQFGWRSRRVECVNDIFGMEALGVGNALLLIDARQDYAVGQPQAFNQIVFNTLRRSVFERGSSTAQRRASGYTERSARSVSRIAVG